LAVVGTLLLATLVPLPGLRGGLKDLSSPSMVLCDWEHRDSETLITWALAVQMAKQVTPKTSTLAIVPDWNDDQLKFLLDSRSRADRNTDENTKYGVRAMEIENQSLADIARIKQWFDQISRQ
jgi:hypothetical protein